MVYKIHVAFLYRAQNSRSVNCKLLYAVDLCVRVTYVFVMCTEFSCVEFFEGRF